MTERKELIARLRWHAKSMCNGDMYREAADMLEADAQPAVPQEPIYRCASCECVYSVKVTQCDCMPDKQEWIEGVMQFGVSAPQQPAVPQKPVAWYEYNADLDAWFLAYGHNPKAKTRPLVFGDAAPQQRPRLTDAEIKAIEHETDMKSSIGDWSNYFARAIEAKVRGEA